MKRKKVLYIGGFELPDKNAAAHRVVAVAKCLRDLDYEVEFIGITHDDDRSGDFGGFGYTALQYPKTKKEWFRYAIGSDIIIIIEQLFPDIIIAYNYPAVALARIICYARSRKVKVVGDITEWYQSKYWYRRLDTFLSMRCVYKNLDGIIAISNYLYDFFSPCKRILLPPIVDKEEGKWKKEPIVEIIDHVRIVYAGKPGRKDLLGNIVRAFDQVCKKQMELIVVGINKEYFINAYGKKGADNPNISFLGKKPHQEVIKILSSSDFQIIIRENNRLCKAGFPTKFVETVTAGVSVIANRFSDIADYLVDGHNGFLLETFETREIANTLSKVAHLSRKEIDEMKANAKKISFDYRDYLSQVHNFFSML